MSEIIALADRVAGLRGPCRETDLAIRAAINLPPAPWDYSYSVEAVVRLIRAKLPGWAWKVGTCCVSDDGWVVPDFNHPVHGERLRKQFGDYAAGSPEDTGIDIDRRPSGNPALALLEAFLRGYALHLSTAKPTTGE